LVGVIVLNASVDLIIKDSNYFLHSWFGGTGSLLCGLGVGEGVN